MKTPGEGTGWCSLLKRMCSRGASGDAFFFFAPSRFKRQGGCKRDVFYARSLSNEEGNLRQNYSTLACENNEADDNEEAEERVGLVTSGAVPAIHHSPRSHLLRASPLPCHCLPPFFSRGMMRYLHRCECKRVLYVFMHTFMPELTSVSPNRDGLVRAFVRVSNIATLWNENSIL